jgi:hypothetical protein
MPRPRTVARLPRALELHAPFTTKILEHSLEVIGGEPARDGLESYRGPKSTVIGNGAVNVGHFALKSRLAHHNLAFNSQRNEGCLALRIGRGRSTAPLAVIWTIRVGTAQLRQQQQVSD